MKRDRILKIKGIVHSTRDAQFWICADIRYADIFQLILADTDIFPFVWKQHQDSPVYKL